MKAKHICPFEARKREKEKRNWEREVMTYTTFQGGERDNNFPALNIFRQCPVLLLVRSKFQRG
jgi:hypothetical protein